MSGSDKDVTVVEAGRTYEQVIIHPLVLLSATDHHYRIAKEIAKKRVVGVLLGETFQGRCDVTNSFAIPFDEDPKDPSIFFLDHDYLEQMFYMHKKINARERIVGFYSTSPKLRPSDIHIDALLRLSPVGLAHPLCVLIDVRPETEGLPIQAYQSIETVSLVAAAPSATSSVASGGAAGSASSSTAATAPAASGTEIVRTFIHIPCAVGAYEAEEVGVEHLLRDINDPTMSSLGGELRHKMGGLKGLSEALGEVSGYLDKVVSGKMPVNHDILATVQATLALLPNTHVDGEFSRSLAEATNDSHLALYAGSLTRAVVAMHDLVTNKASYKDMEALADGTGKEGDKKGEGEEKDKEGKEKEGDKKEGKDKPAATGDKKQ